MTRSAVLPPRFVATILAAALTGLLLLAITPAPVRADDPKSVAVRMDIFRKCLDLLRFRQPPIQSFDELGGLDPKECILIVLGDTGKLTKVPNGLKSFLEQGGATLIASDKPMSPESKAALIDATGFYITGYKWASSPNLDFCYHRIDYCPFLLSQDPRFMRDPNPKTGKPIQPVATNIPSILEVSKVYRDMQVFATVPDGTIIWGPEGLDKKLPGFLGAAGDVGKGRVIVLADHSIFINEMMKPHDTGNVEFTANCLTYLRGEQGQRTRVLFLDDGDIQHTFDTGPKKPSPLAILNGLMNKGQDKLNDIDERDGFNTALTNLADEHPERWRRMLVVLLVLATLALLIYGCYRLGIASRFRAEPGVPSLARAVDQQTPLAGLLQQRHDGVLDVGNLWEAGRQLARDAFEAGGVAAPVPYREPVMKLPKVGWWQRSRMRRRILHLWRLAYLNRPIPVAPRALRALAAELEQLKADLKRGSIRLT